MFVYELRRDCVQGCRLCGFGFRVQYISGMLQDRAGAGSVFSSVNSGATYQALFFAAFRIWQDPRALIA